MIFVDTSVWFAAYVNEEPEGRRAAALLAAPNFRLLTTDYVIDELLTLLIVRGHRAVAKDLGRVLLSERLCRIAWVSRADVAAAWEIFAEFDDKNWSFTDCVSYAVMKRLEIKEAFSLDEHFKQFGFAIVLP